MDKTIFRKANHTQGKNFAIGDLLLHVLKCRKHANCTAGQLVNSE